MKKLIIAAVMVGVVGCTNRIGDYTVLSSKAVDLTQGTKYVSNKDRVTGEDSSPTFFGIPLTGSLNVKTSLDRALEKVPGTVALVDAVISEKSFSLIFGYRSILVEGTPIISPKIQAEMK